MRGKLSSDLGMSRGAHWLLRFEFGWRMFLLLVEEWMVGLRWVAVRCGDGGVEGVMAVMGGLLFMVGTWDGSK